MSAAWAPLALVALLTTCVYSMAMKWLLTDADDEDPALLSAVVFVLTGGAAVLSWRFGGGQAADLAALRGPGVGWNIALDIALYTVAPILYFRAMKLLPVSRVVILHASIGVFTLTGGALLGTEPLTLARLGGAALIVTAILLVQAGPRSASAAAPSALLLLACALYAAAALVDRWLVTSGGLSPDLVLALAFLPPGLLLVLYGLSGRPQPGAVLRHLLRRRVIYLNALALALTYACMYRAYALGGPASGVTLILGAEAVIVALLAAVLLGEREQLARKLLAGLVVVGGLGLVG